MKTYLEIQVPIRYDASWFKKLRTAFTDISVKFQVVPAYHMENLSTNATDKCTRP